jgi:hypothetical protein
MKCLIFGCDHEILWTPWLERAIGSEIHKSDDWHGVIDPSDNFDNGTYRSIGSDTVRSGPNYTQFLIDQSVVSFNRIVLVHFDVAVKHYTCIQVVDSNFDC